MKTVVITGGSSGIGAASAKLLSQTCSVFILDINQPDFTDKYYQVDVSDGESVAQAFEQIGPIDALVHTAGIYVPKELSDMPDERIGKQIEINLTGTAIVDKYALQHVKDGGVIVNVSSGLGVVPEPESPVYCATKAGVNMLTKALAQRYASRGIRVNAVMPGPIDTPMLRNAFPSEEEFRAYESMNPLGRAGKPDEVAKLIQYLISDDAGYITGACIAIDGGESSSSLYSMKGLA